MKMPRQKLFMCLKGMLPLFLSLIFVFLLHLLLNASTVAKPEQKQRISFSLAQKPKALQKKQTPPDNLLCDIAAEKTAALKTPALDINLQKMQMQPVQISLAGSGNYAVFGEINAPANSGALLDSMQKGDAKRYSMQIFELASLDKIPKRLNSVKINYPKNLLKRGIQGTVVLVVVIDENGFLSVEKVEKSDYAEFAEQAIYAAQKLRYEPPTINGKPVKARFTLPIPFRILK